VFIKELLLGPFSPLFITKQQDGKEFIKLNILMPEYAVIFAYNVGKVVRGSSKIVVQNQVNFLF
jgi:hypothetical protein